MYCCTSQHTKKCGVEVLAEVGFMCECVSVFSECCHPHLCSTPGHFPLFVLARRSSSASPRHVLLAGNLELVQASRRASFSRCGEIKESVQAIQATYRSTVRSACLLWPAIWAVHIVVQDRTRTHRGCARVAAALRRRISSLLYSERNRARG